MKHIGETIVGAVVVFIVAVTLILALNYVKPKEDSGTTDRITANTICILQTSHAKVCTKMY